MDFGKLVKCLIQDNKSGKVQRTDFVNFMETVESPFVALIATILSLRTNDKTTYGATLRMLEIGNTPSDFANCNVEKLANAIYPVGFYKNKAEQIIELSKILCDKYNSQVPNSIDELVKFKGVGRKTANLVLAKGFNLPAICVDVHVHRICNRLGFLNTKTPDETEMKLREILPKEFWTNFNTLLVTHGQNICRPQKPMCTMCSISDLCKSKNS